MTRRIAIKEIEDNIAHLNRVTDGKYQLGMAYGGHRLEKLIDGTSGGITTVTGYITKRELNEYINAMLEGIEAVTS